MKSDSLLRLVWIAGNAGLCGCAAMTAREPHLQPPPSVPFCEFARVELDPVRPASTDPLAVHYARSFNKALAKRFRNVCSDRSRTAEGRTLRIGFADLDVRYPPMRPGTYLVMRAFSCPVRFRDGATEEIIAQPDFTRELVGEGLPPGSFISAIADDVLRYYLFYYPDVPGEE